MYAGLQQRRSCPGEEALGVTGGETVLYILDVVVVLLKPALPSLPSWLPVSVVRVAAMLEHLRRWQVKKLTGGGPGCCGIAGFKSRSGAGFAAAAAA